jgi:hypothetical protein
MALPRQTDSRRRPVSWLLVPAVLLAAAASAAAGGAVMSTQGDEPLPASRPPLSRPRPADTGRGVGTPPPAQRSPCPHPHKCADTQPAAARQVAFARSDIPRTS